MDSVKYWRRLHRATISALSLAFLLSAPAGVHSQDDPGSDGGAALLERFVDEVDDLSARFVEHLYEADGELSETSTGRFLLLRPDRFVWQYETPYDYRLISDGETLWTFDVDLEQITRAPLEELEDTPAMLLSGEDGFGDRYEVRDAAPGDVRSAVAPDARWLELVPRDGYGDFLEARIAFRDGAPAALELVNNLGALTVVEFTDIEINESIDADVFAFEPPPGIDVAGDD